jgi:hypothetical protein
VSLFSLDRNAAAPGWQVGFSADQSAAFLASVLQTQASFLATIADNMTYISRQGACAFF